MATHPFLGMRSVMICGASAAVACAATQASAQAQEDAIIQEQESTSIQELVVTAQRRSERLKDVPLSVTALQPEALTAAGVTTSVELPMVTPGLRMDATGIFIQPAIRGITTTQTSPAAEANVATYLDGVYMQSMMSAIYDLPDVEQIQVLKGPQGTLFGRNATGGALLISTLSPDLERIKGKVGVSYGSYDNLILKGVVSLPIVEDKLAISITGFYNRMGSYKRDLLNGGRKQGAGMEDYLIRGKIRFKPWEGADFTLTGVYTRRDDDSSLKYSNYKGNNIGRVLAPDLPVASRPWEYAMDVRQDVRKTHKGVTLHGDIEVGPGTFTTITHYDKNPNDITLDADNGAAALGKILFPAYSKNRSQEFLYTTNQLGRIRAVGGVFLYELRTDNLLDVNDFTQAIYWTDHAKAAAVFGEMTYDVSDRLSVTGGLRYSYEKREAFAGLGINTPVRPTLNKLGERSWEALTPRVSVLYEATDRTNVYATFSQGFKSGTFNSVGFQTKPVNPEKVNAFEVGVKSDDITGLSWSAAAFYYKYTDLQVTTITQDGLATTTTLSNAATAKIYGLEVSGTWQVTDDFDLTFGATYLHARYSSFPDAVVNVPTGFGGNTTVALDASGNTMIRSPTFSANLTAHYSKETPIGTFDASTSLAYSSKIYFEFGNIIVQPKYALLNANLSWKPHDSRLEFSIIGKNLTNKAIIASVTDSQLYTAVDYNRPRTFAVEIGYRF